MLNRLVDTRFDGSASSVLRRRLLSGDNSIYLYDGDGIFEGFIDVTLIQCHWGVKTAQISASKRSLDILLRSSPLPLKWAFIEAQKGGVDRQFEWLRDYGVEYLFVELSDDSDEIFMKESLWNIAARKVTGDNLIFLDSDIVFCNRGWLNSVARAFDKYDIMSVHSYGYYAEQPVGTAVRFLMPSIGENWLGGNPFGFPGFTVGMTRRVFEDIGGFPIVSCYSGDVWFWTMVFGDKKISKIDNLPYCSVPDSWKGGLCEYYSVGATGEVCAHVSHGDIANRNYSIQRYFSRACNSYPQEDLDLSGELPVWAKNSSGVIHHACRKRLSDGLPEGDKMSAAKLIYKDELMKYNSRR